VTAAKSIEDILTSLMQRAFFLRIYGIGQVY